MNFKKYKRFFAFGCSFTNFHWPSWANIIGQEISEFYNYGQQASGNTLIFHRLVEANIRHQFSEDDLVMVMWTTPMREDRFIDRWHLLRHPNKFILDFHGDDFSQVFFKNYVSEKGRLLSDLTLVNSASHLLKNVKCDFHFLSMVPFDLTENKQNNSLLSDMRDTFFWQTSDNVITDFFKETLTLIKPDIFTKTLKSEWKKSCRAKWNSVIWEDYHPDPKTYFDYLIDIFPQITFKKDTIEYVNYWQNKMKEDPYDTLQFDEFTLQYDLYGNMITQL